jgi:large subunit ribosomal protein L21
MYAIIVDGGRQYKVTEGQELVIDYRDASSGDAVQFDQVVAYSNGSKLKLGEPTVGGATVTAKVLGVLQGPKLTVQKFRRRKTYRRKTGHRQLYTKVQIEKITAGK